jgi:hypothetical protein
MAVLAAVAAAARRAGRCPVGAQAGAVGAERRLRCGARACGLHGGTRYAPSSLRSNSRRESEDEAREYARRPQALRPCRPRQAGGPAVRQAQTVRMDCLCPGSPSPPQTAPPPDTARRSAPALVFGGAQNTVPAKVWAGGRWCACAQPRVSPDTNSPYGLFVPGERPGLRPGAACKAAGVPARARTRALRHLTHGGCSSAANAVSAASSAVGPGLRVPQGTPAQQGQAAARHRPPAHAFARGDVNSP